MNFCGHCWIKVMGMYVLCDGWGSLIAYVKTDETWWRNHSVRIARMIVGLLLIICG